MTLPFPSVAAIAPHISMPCQFAWSAPDLTVLDAIWAEQSSLQRNLPKFWRFTQAIIGDLAEARATASNNAEVQAIDCARFISCAPAMFITRANGQWGDCYSWIWSAVSATHQHGERINENVVNLGQVDQISRGLFQRYIFQVPIFTASAYYVAYRLGGLDDLTSLAADFCWNYNVFLLTGSTADDSALEGLVQMLIWAGHRGWPAGGDWGRYLKQIFDSNSHPQHKKLIALAFTSPANQYVDGSPQDWAELLLTEHSEELVEHERLQVLAVSLRGYSDWVARKAEILEEIRSVRTLYWNYPREGASMLEALETRVSIIWPILFVLAEWGVVEDAFEVVGAWYRRDGAEPSDANVLLVVPVRGRSPAYLWPGGRWLVDADDLAAHNAMQHAVTAALGNYVRGFDGDRDPTELQGMRFDVPISAAGPELERSITAYYRLTELSRRLPADWSPRAVVVFPSGPEPLQAVLAKTTNIAAPTEISFERASATRPIRRLAVWVGGSMHAEFELEAIRHIATRAQWDLHIQRPSDQARAELKSLYEDSQFDAIWIISHGIHDHFSFSGTGLNMPDDSLLSGDEVARWSVPDRGRRLLVLNSCSGAASQGRGGVARMGLAQSLVSARQSVIGHLWPVHWKAALAFGAALAAKLETESPELAYFQAAELMRDGDLLVRFLETAYLGCNQVLDRIRLSAEDLSSIPNWGSSALLT